MCSGVDIYTDGCMDVWGNMCAGEWVYENMEVCVHKWRHVDICMSMHVCESMCGHDMYRYLYTDAHGCIGSGYTHVRISCVCTSVCECDHVQVCTCACVCMSVPVNIWECACMPVYGEHASICLLALPSCLFGFIWF